MKKKNILFLGVIGFILILVGCEDNPDTPTGGAICPKFECVKTTAPAKFSVETVDLSGKGPILLSGSVNPKVKVTNPNDQPALFQVNFNCKNLFKNTEEVISSKEIWLQPESSEIFEGTYKVGRGENWECGYEVSASAINSCELRQVY